MNGFTYTSMDYASQGQARPNRLEAAGISEDTRQSVLHLVTSMAKSPQFKQQLKNFDNFTQQYYFIVSKKICY